ncbi:MAG TPA: NHLP-related RiPP peptide [Arenimonas sp.]|uniref:NHLP-related RiPP peptide n=1 Tax=Arenimonas sp. TaxID=1872635 RepID=UPI002C705FE6|nr:NHLP-related RiPP peptide [Arenimonas sp.]HMB57783.1 NHLP-related RiPP peptide [Arenimonas sp.]
MAKPFSPDVADKLLNKLSSDDDFRALFEKNPRAALKQVGHETPETDRDVKGADHVLCCYSVKTLASKEQIKAAHKELKAQLSQLPFHYEMAALGTR